MGDLPAKQWALRFQDGTLVLEGASLDEVPMGYVHDGRVDALRGPAWLYADTVLTARDSGVMLHDEARAYQPLENFVHLTERSSRPYQAEALEAWTASNRRGAVILPTGAGKSFVAEMAIAQTARPTMVVAPTLDLVGQWHHQLSTAFDVEVGILGGGHHEIRPITVTTYDSAYLHLPRYGDRFGLVVFDEVHHLPAQGYLSAAAGCIAPFRLGLTATWERQDGREELLEDVLGEVVYRREITELSGEYLADYEVVQLTVHLDADEQERYDEARALFTGFVRRHGIPLGAPGGWQQFLRKVARSREGRHAFRAYQESRRIAHGTEKKLDLLETLLMEEWGRRTIVFTHDNATAYRISREFLVPCISHQTDLKERRRILQQFESGDLPVLVTSRVLNEGVDLPAAEVAVVLSGTGTVREHVQRLGRILRPNEDKQAILYEVVAAGTAEVKTSARRRRHLAYR